MDGNIIISGDKVIFRKALWEQGEVLLAQCHYHTVDLDTNTITADLRLTFRKALHDFISHCYPAFFHQPQYADEKAALLRDIDAIYKKIQSGLIAIHKEKLPWYPMLFRHQRQALVSMHYRRANMLSFEPRLGKTITCASMSIIHNIQRTVVICYSVGKWNFMYDMTDPKWKGQEILDAALHFTILDARKNKSFNAFDEKFIIVNYESLGRFLDRIIDGGFVPIGHIIISECQKMKNHNSSTFKNICKLIEACPDARVTYESGTPVLNRTNDVFSYYNAIGHPLGASYLDFKRQYSTTDARHGNVNGSRNTDDLRLRQSNFVIRRTQDECTDMPKHSYVNLYFNLDDWQAEYKKAIYEAMRIKGRVAIDAFIQSINRIMALAKVPGIIEHADILVDSGQKVIIFFGYKDPILKIEQHFGDACVRIDGSIGGHEKMERARRFMTDPTCMVCVANMTAAGHSIDLSVANHVILGNFPMSPKTIEQALDRTKNLKKTTPTTAYFCIAKGDDGKPTVDERLADLVGGKDSDINHLFDGANSEGFQDNVSTTLWKDLMESYKEEFKVFNHGSSSEEKEYSGGLHSGDTGELEDGITGGRSILLD